MVKVRYTGWDPKYDEWINAESYRLAPLRTHTPAAAPRTLRINPDAVRQVEQIRASNDYEGKFRMLLEAKMKCTIVPMAGDGNCMFRSVSHQVYGNAEFHFIVRQKCMEYMRSEQAFYRQYIEGDFHHYIERMKVTNCYARGIRWYICALCDGRLDTSLTCLPLVVDHACSSMASGVITWSCRP
jgi:hypothetical protein